MLLVYIKKDGFYILLHILFVLSSIKKGILKSATVPVDLSIFLFSLMHIVSGSVIRHIGI